MNVLKKNSAHYIVICFFFCRYKKAVDCLEMVKLKDSSEEQEMNKLLSSAYTNLGVCYNKIDMPRNACLVCNRVPFPTAKTHYQYVTFLNDTIVYKNYTWIKYQINIIMKLFFLLFISQFRQSSTKYCRIQ